MASDGDRATEDTAAPEQPEGRMSGTTSSGRKWPNLTTLIFLGIGLGTLVGLFLGELAAPLSLLGTAFVRLSEMQRAVAISRSF